MSMRPDTRLEHRRSGDALMGHAFVEAVWGLHGMVG
jgi:hypothetical protein